MRRSREPLGLAICVSWGAASIAFTLELGDNMAGATPARELHVAYTHRGLVVGWRCSQCKRAFFVPWENATDVLEAPPPIRAEFHEHHCDDASTEQSPKSQWVMS